MKSIQLFLITLALGLCKGCAPDLCEGVDCVNGDCLDGICYCPDGFSGKHCEIEDCFGVGCLNGDCDPQTKTCNCHPNYYGEDCSIFCLNGVFENGDCICSEGYEGTVCETESRCRFIGWWGCEQWTIASQIGASPIPGFLPATLKIEEGDEVFGIELFPIERSTGLLLLSSEHRIVGRVNKNMVNFELQNLPFGRTVHGSANFNESNRILSVELFLFNPDTSLTEVASGTFRLARHFKD